MYDTVPLSLNTMFSFLLYSLKKIIIKGVILNVILSLAGMLS